MWLFKKEHSSESQRLPQPKRVSVKIDGRFLSIDSLDFFGPCVVSKNHRYVLGWSDFNRSSGVGGFRTHGRGCYILLEEDFVIVQDHLERPNDGAIADNGTFVLNDWLFGDGLKGIFYAFDQTGTQIIKHLFNANLLNSGLSDDGKYAVCQLAHSDTPDGGTLAFFDLQKGSLVWQKQPETGWAQAYEFDVENQVVFLIYKDIGRFRYAFSGGFLDDQQWYQARVAHGSGFDLSQIGRAKLNACDNPLTTEAAQEIQELLQKALGLLENYPNEKAIVHKAIGELYERLQNKSSAIEHYELALKFNPKVGVKRKLSTLKGQAT